MWMEHPPKFPFTSAHEVSVVALKQCHVPLMTRVLLADQEKSVEHAVKATNRTFFLMSAYLKEPFVA